MKNVILYPDPAAANEAAAVRLASWLADSQTRHVMVAAGNTPLDLYRRIAQRALNLAHLHIFALDEYVGVPPDEPRTCSNVLKRSVADAWKVPADQFHSISSRPAEALSSVIMHERRIAEAGGLDVVVLGLGENGHLGFNEPGSPASSSARVAQLEPSSAAAARAWFGDHYSPTRGVTIGLRTILAARHVLLLAYGSHKAKTVHAMVRGPQSPRCPASFLQSHPDAWVFVDPPAAELIRPRSTAV